MKERTFAAQDYTYGFNGQEQDTELLGGAVSFKYRVHDPRIGRFLSVDPLAPEYPWNSAYAFAANSPIFCIDKDGAGPEPSIYAKTDGVLARYLNNSFVSSLMTSNNTSVREFEKWALGTSTDPGAKNKIKGAYGEALTAVKIANAWEEHTGSLDNLKLVFQNKRLNGDRSTPDITLSFQTYSFKVRIPGLKYEREKYFTHTFNDIGGVEFDEKFESTIPSDWMLQYEVKTINPKNNLSTNYGYIKRGIEQIEFRINSQEGLFTEDIVGVLVTDRAAYMILYNANPTIDGVEFRDMMEDFLEVEDHYLLLIDKLNETSEKGIHSAKDNVEKEVRESGFQRKPD